MKIDIIIPLKTSLLSLVVDRTIPSIINNISYNKIYIVTKSTNFKKLKNTFGETIVCLDENKICDGLTLNNIQEYFKKQNENIERSGWYFQQFLKLSVSKLDFITNLYLVWDADAVVLNPISFFSKENKIYIEKTNEFHKPYFITLKKILGLKKQVKFSFIAEYLVFDKKIVKEMLLKISKNDEWWYTILDNIDSEDIGKSGFSEYETYGNYIAKFYKDKFTFRNLNKSRKGVRYLGKKPNKNLLNLFSFSFDYISFEQWHTKYKPLSFRILIMFFVICKGFLEKRIKYIYNSLKS